MTRSPQRFPRGSLGAGNLQLDLLQATLGAAGSALSLPPAGGPLLTQGSVTRQSRASLSGEGD